MAWTACYVADRADPATPLWSFIDTTGVINPGGVKCWVKGIDKGSYAANRDLFEPDIGNVAEVARLRFPAVAASIHLRTEAPDHTAHRMAIGRLLWLLQGDRVLVVQEQGATEAEWWYTVGADVVQLLRGGIENLDQIINMMRDPDGFVLPIVREAAIRSPELNPDLNLLDNPMFLRDLDGTVGPDAWAWLSSANITSEVVASEGEQFVTTTASTRDLRQSSAVGTFASGDVAAASFYALTNAAGVGKAAVAIVVEYLDGGGTLLGSANVSGTTQLTTREQRITYVAPAAPASTSRVRLSIRVDSLDATNTTYILRRAQLEKAVVTRFRVPTQTVVNDLTATSSGTRVIALWNDGNVPAPFRLVSQMDTLAAVREVLMARRGSEGVVGKRSLTDLLNGPSWLALHTSARGWTITLGTDTTAVSADARTTHATNPTLFARRVRATRTTLLDCLRGTFDVYYRAKPSATATYEVMLKWSPSLADPAAYANVADTATITTVGGGTYVEKYLGRFQLPVDTSVTLAGLALEVWTRRVSGSGNLDQDVLWFVPADVEQGDAQGKITVEGGSQAAYDIPTFVGGASFVSPGALTNGTPSTLVGNQPAYRLDAVNEAGGGPPAAGIALPTGRHRITITYVVTMSANVGHTMQVRLAARNITGASDAASVDLLIVRGGTYTATLEFDAAGGALYQPQVRMIAMTTPTTESFNLTSMVDEFVPALLGNEQLRTDPGDRYTVEKLDSADAYVSELTSEGVVPMMFDPGLSLLFVRALDSAASGYTDLKSDSARSITVQPFYSPGNLV